MIDDRRRPTTPPVLRSDCEEGLLRHSLESIDEETTIDEFTKSAMSGGEGTALLPPLQKQSSSRRAEIRLIHSTLEEVEKVAQKRIGDGLNEVNFTVGVANTMLVVWVFGVCPQHFWLLYLVEGCYLLPARLYSNSRTKPLSSVLFFLDFCWQMNLMVLVILLIFVVDSLVGISGSEMAHKQLFLAAVGIACGPLLGVNIALPFICLLFHDVNTLAGFFIHMFPPLVMYTLIWNADNVRQAWP